MDVVREVFAAFAERDVEGVLAHCERRRRVQRRHRRPRRADRALPRPRRPAPVLPRRLRGLGRAAHRPGRVPPVGRPDPGHRPGQRPLPGADRGRLDGMDLASLGRPGRLRPRLPLGGRGNGSVRGPGRLSLHPRVGLVTIEATQVVRATAAIRVWALEVAHTMTRGPTLAQRRLAALGEPAARGGLDGAAATAGLHKAGGAGALERRRCCGCTPASMPSGHVALTLDSRRIAAVMACGPGALLSHRAAGEATGLLHSSPQFEVTVPRGRKPKPGIVVHRSRLIHPEDRSTVRGIPVTSVARTLVDLADVVERATARQGRCTRPRSGASST